ncbi:unnamed protein product [Closterium sp. Naga37s-1]|nr:unnamed protein product [Closterium sp. Naga37s-1]
MGLFGDLPPPSNAPKPPTRANPPSSTSTPSSKPSTPAERPAAVGPKPSALKSSLKGRADAWGEEGTGNASAGDAGGGSVEGGKTRKRVGMAVADEADGDAPSHRRVRFNTFAEVAEDKVTSAIAKISAHIGTPTKFKKAASLARQLLEGGALNRAATSGMNSTDNSAVESGHSGLFFGVLEAAMGLLRREGGGGAGGMVVGAAGDVESEYAALIGAAVERKELFSAWQQQQVDVWGLRTDDSFQFSKAVSRVQQDVERLPEAAEEDERQEAGLFAGVSMQVQSQEGGVEGEGEGEKGQEKGEESVERKRSKDQESRGGDEMGEEERREDKKEKENDDTNAAEGAADSAADHFGLDAMLGLSGDKGGGKGATQMYRHKWAQTAIDMLAQHAYDHRRRFTGRQRAAIEALWTSVRHQQHERKHGAGRGGTGRLDVTAFERLQRHYEGKAISIRKGVGGGGGRSTITWLG